jgi:hypothetical protein
MMRVRMHEPHGRRPAYYARAKIAWQAAQDEFEAQFGRARAKALRSELFGVIGQR